MWIIIKHFSVNFQFKYILNTAQSTPSWAAVKRPTVLY